MCAVRTDILTSWDRPAEVAAGLLAVSAVVVLVEIVVVHLREFLLDDFQRLVCLDCCAIFLRQLLRKLGVVRDFQSGRRLGQLVERHAAQLIEIAEAVADQAGIALAEVRRREWAQQPSPDPSGDPS